MTTGKQPPKSSHEKHQSEKASQTETQGKSNDGAKSPGAKKGRFPKGFQLDPGRTSGIAGYAAPDPDERRPAPGKGVKGLKSKD